MCAAHTRTRLAKVRQPLAHLLQGIFGLAISLEHHANDSANDSVRDSVCEHAEYFTRRVAENYDSISRRKWEGGGAKIALVDIDDERERESRCVIAATQSILVTNDDNTLVLFLLHLLI